MELPAYAALSWDDLAGAYLLIPDRATFPLRAYRATLNHLLVLRGSQGQDFPTLLVATTDRARAGAWERLLEDGRRARTEAPLVATIATWSELHNGFTGLAASRHADAQLAERLVQHIGVRPIRTRSSGRPLRRLIDDALLPPSKTTARGTRPGIAALGLTEADRKIVDIVGRHPFLTLPDLAMVLGWPVRRVRRRRDDLVSAGLLRLPEPGEINGIAVALEPAELTVEGMTVAAAQQGLSPAAAVRYNGLAGGGPDQRVGSRRKLLQSLAHTTGTDHVFASLFGTARQLVRAGSDDAMVDWRNAAACSRRHVRPDGYGVYRHAGQLYGFFLEYDRATMNVRDYLEKFSAYYDYLVGGRFQEDYDGFPTILMVTRDHAAEERIATAARLAAVGRGGTLPLLLTCEWRITDGRNPPGLLGAIWREPDAAFSVRRHWPIVPAGAAFARPAATSMLQVNGGSYAGTKR
ncbi:MAG: replication-relaxation family protein [Chloroflexi bacterium]|nr:replication-relaxation family protein [Chloroflexota bacterium]